MSDRLMENTMADKFCLAYLWCVSQALVTAQTSTVQVSSVNPSRAESSSRWREQRVYKRKDCRLEKMKASQSWLANYVHKEVWQFTVFLLKICSKGGKVGGSRPKSIGRIENTQSQRMEEIEVGYRDVNILNKGLKSKWKNDHLHSFNCVKSKKQKHIQPNTRTHTHAQTHTQHAMMRSCTKTTRLF